MKKRFSVAALFQSALLFLGISAAQADILPPSGLNPGEQFRLVFVSSQTRISDEASFGPLDQFIAGLADAAGLGVYNGSPVGWHVLGSQSLPGLSAIARLPNSAVPIYDINGDLVANAAHDIWSGTLLHAIDYTETAVISATLVWTATLPTGHVPPSNQGLGDFGDEVVGSSSASDGGWVDFGEAFNLNPAHSFYGFSDVITVAAPVPEPNTMTLLVTTATLLGLLALRWHRKGGEERPIA
jgi:hypothetical protein